MEPHAHEGLGSSTKPDTDYYDHIGRLVKRGYESLLSYYEKVSPLFHEPLYARPARTSGVEVYLIGEKSGEAIYSIMARLCSR